MNYIKKYIINSTPPFEEDLENIYRYLKFVLKEPITAKNFYNKVIKEIHSLQFFPERYTKIQYSNDTNRNLRRLPINNYILIYEVDSNTRSSFYLTYFSWKSKLF